jgi:hypothetical protein
MEEYTRMQRLGELHGTTNTFCSYLVTNVEQLPNVFRENLFFEKLKCIFECIFEGIHLSWRA